MTLLIKCAVSMTHDLFIHLCSQLCPRLEVLCPHLASLTVDINLLT